MFPFRFLHRIPSETSRHAARAYELFLEIFPVYTHTHTLRKPTNRLRSESVATHRQQRRSRENDFFSRISSGRKRTVLHWNYGFSPEVHSPTRFSRTSKNNPPVAALALHPRASEPENRTHLDMDLTIYGSTRRRIARRRIILFATA